MNKLKGKLLAIIVIMFGLVLFVSPNVNAAELIEKIVIDAYEFMPVVGEKLYMHTVGETDNYEIVEQTWYDPDRNIINDINNKKVTFDETKGICGLDFYCQMIIKPKAGYEFSNDFKVEFKDDDYNKKVGTLIYNSGTVSTTDGTATIAFGVNAYKLIKNDIVIDGTEITNTLLSGTGKQKILEDVIALQSIEGLKYNGDAFVNLPSYFIKGEEYAFKLTFLEDASYIFPKGATITINNVNWKEGTTHTSNRSPMIEVLGEVEYDIDRNAIIDAEDLLLIQGNKAPILNLISDEYKIVSQKWTDNNDNEVTNIDNAGIYTYQMILKPIKYKFISDTLLNMTGANWETSSYQYITSGENAGCISFTGTQKSNKLIKKVEIDLSSIKPELNKNAGNITINSKEYEIINQGWFSIDDPVNQITKFDKKTMYIYAIALNTKEGYVFADDLKITIKGITWDTVIIEDANSDYVHFAAGVTLGNKLNVSKGQNQTYTMGQEKDFTFTVNGDFSKFNALYANGMLVDQSAYEVKGDKNSTIITINKDFMDGVDEGKYSFVADFGDSGMAILNFAVDDPTTEYNPGKVDDKEDIKKNPETSDNIMLAVSTLAVASAGIVTTTILNKKRKNNKG